jgi:hypothetical protein
LRRISEPTGGGGERPKDGAEAFIVGADEEGRVRGGEGIGVGVGPNSEAFGF